MNDKSPKMPMKWNIDLEMTAIHINGLDEIIELLKPISRYFEAKFQQNELDK